MLEEGCRQGGVGDKAGEVEWNRSEGGIVISSRSLGFNLWDRSQGGGVNRAPRLDGRVETIRGVGGWVLWGLGTSQKNLVPVWAHHTH